MLSRMHHEPKTLEVAMACVSEPVRMQRLRERPLGFPTDWRCGLTEAAGITLVAIARDDGFEVFAHGGRTGMAAVEHVA